MIQIFSPTIRRKEMDSVLTCMVDEKIGPGEINEKFVSEIKAFSDCAGAVIFRNTSTALNRALKALLIPEGSSIALSALCPRWQKIAVEDAGFVPIFADIDENTACISAKTLSSCVENGAKAIIVSEPFGQIPEDIEDIVSLGIPVIEDISESAGGTLNEKKAGSFGSFAIWGFEANDIITTGGGAALCFPEKQKWEAFLPLFRKTLKSDILPDLNCALGLTALKEWRKNEEIRRSIATVYRCAILQSRRHKIFSRAADNDFSVCSFPIVISDGVKEVLSFLDRKEIGSKLAFSDTAIADIAEDENTVENLSVATSLFSRTILVPLYPRLRSQQIETISKVLAALP